MSCKYIEQKAGTSCWAVVVLALGLAVSQVEFSIGSSVFHRVLEAHVHI